MDKGDKKKIILLLEKRGILVIRRKKKLNEAKVQKINFNYFGASN